MKVSLWSLTSLAWVFAAGQGIYRDSLSLPRWKSGVFQVHFADVKKHLPGSFVKRSMEEAQFSITVPYFGTIDQGHASNYDAVLQTIARMCPNAQFFTGGLPDALFYVERLQWTNIC